MSGYAEQAADAFGRSRGCFEQIVVGLAAADADGQTHAELEEHLAGEGRELIRLLLQDHLDLRAVREPRQEQLVDVEQVAHTRVEPEHRRGLATIFGQVTVTRLGYRAVGARNLYPADARLNLPAEKYSHGLRRLAAVESVRGSFEQAAEAVGRFQVLEYLWKAAWSLFYTSDPAAEAWVAEQATKILEGKAGQVAAGIRRRATTFGYSTCERAGADACAGLPDRQEALPGL
jgi:hypothetical protein